MRRLPTGAPARVLVATRPPGAAFGAPVEVAGAIKAGVEDVINKLERPWHAAEGGPRRLSYRPPDE